MITEEMLKNNGLLIRYIRNRIEQEGRIVPIVSSPRFSSKEDIKKSKQLANKIYYNQHSNT